VAKVTAAIVSKALGGRFAYNFIFQPAAGGLVLAAVFWWIATMTFSLSSILWPPFHLRKSY
jgi:hypothetical protein